MPATTARSADASGHGKGLRPAVEVGDASARPGQGSGHPQHRRGRVDAGDPGPGAGCRAGRVAGPHPTSTTWSALVVAGQVDGELAVVPTPEREADGRASAGEPRRTRGSGRGGWAASVGEVHGRTLTVEPDFKSSGSMDEPSLTIGEVAQRAGVATSAVRYYERLGLLEADARRSGQRRFREETLRRLVFIGMLQDAGLTLDEVAGILTAGSRGRVEGDRRRPAWTSSTPRSSGSSGPALPEGSAPVSLRPPRHRLQGHGRGDRPAVGGRRPGPAVWRWGWGGGRPLAHAEDGRSGDAAPAPGPHAGHPHGPPRAGPRRPAARHRGRRRAVPHLRAGGQAGAPLGRRHRGQGLPGRRRGDRAPPTATSSSCCASPRRGPGAIPAPVNDQMRREEIDHVVRDSGATLVLRSAAGRRRRRARWPRPTRPIPVTWPRSSTRRAPPARPRARPSPTGPSSARRPAPRCGPPACTATRRSSRCPSPTSWASPCSSAWPSPASRPTCCPSSTP